MSSAKDKKTGSAASSAEWFEDEHFWKSTFPFIFSEERFAAAEAEVTQLVKLTGSPYRQVLDLGRGPGRHSIPLARQGARVTAVDRSPFLLEKARSRAEAGFEKVKLFGSLQGIPYDLKAQRLVAVAQKQRP